MNSEQKLKEDIGGQYLSKWTDAIRPEPTQIRDDGTFFYQISNCCQQQQQRIYTQPCIYYYPVPCGKPKPKKTKQSNPNKETALLKEKIRQLESRAPEVQIVKEIVEVTNNEQVVRLQKELSYYKLQLENEKEIQKSKDVKIYELQSIVQRNELSRSSMLSELQKQIVDREKQITKQDLEINRLRGLLEDNMYELDEFRQKYRELEMSQTDTYTEKTTILQQEINTWKTRFVQLNRDYFANQEKLLLLEAEIEAIKKRDVQEIKEVKYEQLRTDGRQIRDQAQYEEFRKSQYKERSSLLKVPQ